MRLSVLYPLLDRDSRAELARRAKTREGYLWQIATRWRGKKPSIDLLSRLAAADERLTIAEMVEEFAETARPMVAAELSSQSAAGELAIAPVPMGGEASHA